MAADVETEGAALWADTWQRAHNLAGATLALGGLSLDDIDSDAFELGVASGAAGAFEAARDCGLLR